MRGGLAATHKDGDQADGARAFVVVAV